MMLKKGTPLFPGDVGSLQYFQHFHLTLRECLHGVGGHDRIALQKLI